MQYGPRQCLAAQQRVRGSSSLSAGVKILATWMRQVRTTHRTTIGKRPFLSSRAQVYSLLGWLLIGSISGHATWSEDADGETERRVNEACRTFGVGRGRSNYGLPKMQELHLRISVDDVHDRLSLMGCAERDLGEGVAVTGTKLDPVAVGLIKWVGRQEESGSGAD